MGAIQRGYAQQIGAIMDAYEKYCKLTDILGAGKLADEIFSWFTSDTMDECMDDIANTWDIDFSDEYGE